ncbi:ribose 5-phosphate isomerase B [Propionispira arboris]|uniref:Ribose 5-phosphate isomerase B n=1 Tax=Propionispira arboris TaxID=84035 RepID=A0A1H6VCW7_9FIRM|nr:ribose 5-phosphate isomerase B [Propionispira arboris]SEJ02413.1 ribose 5-phosphate isomerase B [Propionispira arboris]
MKQVVVIGSDHAGFLMKQIIAEKLRKDNFEVEDIGTDSEKSVDFAPIAKSVAENVANNLDKKGILICGTGIGMSIMANKVAGIRASLVHDLFSAHATREHNNSNILCMGARIIAVSMACEIVDTWLAAPFLKGKYEKRLDYITDYEKEHTKK